MYTPQILSRLSHWPSFSAKTEETSQTFGVTQTQRHTRGVEAAGGDEKAGDVTPPLRLAGIRNTSPL